VKGIALLIAAIVFEILGTTSMKLSAGFTRLTPSVLLFVFYAISFTLFTFAVKFMDVSVAYAIWAGSGTAIITIIGFFVFDEPMNFSKIAAVTLIILGVVWLNLTGAVH